MMSCTCVIFVYIVMTCTYMSYSQSIKSQDCHKIVNT